MPSHYACLRRGIRDRPPDCSGQPQSLGSGTEAAGTDGFQATGIEQKRWLARRIVADPRFAEAAVKFWRPAITCAAVASSLAHEPEADYAGQLLGSAAQLAEIRQLAPRVRMDVHE